MSAQEPTAILLPLRRKALHYRILYQQKKWRSCSCTGCTRNWHNMIVCLAPEGGRTAACLFVSLPADRGRACPSLPPSLLFVRDTSNTWCAHTSGYILYLSLHTGYWRMSLLIQCITTYCCVGGRLHAAGISLPHLLTHSLTVQVY